MTQAQIEARRRGGVALQNKYSEEVKREWCRRGGRPRALDIDELRALRLENKLTGG